MKIYPNQRSLVSMLFHGRINELENKLTILKRKLTNPRTKAKSLPNIQRDIEWRTEWLAELKEGYEQFQNQPNSLEADLQKQYNQLMDDYIESMYARINLLQEIAESRFAEVDLLIERERSDVEYLSRESLEVRFTLCKYRQN